MKMFLLRLSYLSISGFLSALFVGLVFAFAQVLFVTERRADTYYFGFWEVFVPTIVIALSIYLLIGVPIALLVEWWQQRLVVRNRALRYGLMNVLYSGAGLLAFVELCLIYWLFFNPQYNEFAPLQTMIVAIVSSLIFYHATLPFRKRFTMLFKPAQRTDEQTIE